MDPQEVRQQVEYYLSDGNLSRDQFFHGQLSQVQNNGCLPIKLLLNCNKIKKLNVKDASEIIACITESKEIEITENKQSIRRKDSKPLPDLIVKQRKLNDEDPSEPQYVRYEESKKKSEHSGPPIIFTLSTEKQGSADWRNLTNALQKQFNKSPHYVRFSKTEGNFALYQNDTLEEEIKKLTSQELKIGDQLVKIQLTEGDQLKTFWDLHGGHYKGIQQRKKKDEKTKAKADSRKKFKQGIIFADEKYNDINTVKNMFKTLLSRANIDELIQEPHHAMLLQLVKYHDNKEKFGDLKNFTVSIHPEHKDTRCFFVIRNDGSQQDFSFTKCIKNLEQKLGQEK